MVNVNFWIFYKCEIHEKKKLKKIIDKKIVQDKNQKISEEKN